MRLVLCCVEKHSSTILSPVTAVVGSTGSEFDQTAGASTVATLSIRIRPQICTVLCEAAAVSTTTQERPTSRTLLKPILLKRK